MVEKSLGHITITARWWNVCCFPFRIGSSSTNGILWTELVPWQDWKCHGKFHLRKGSWGFERSWNLSEKVMDSDSLLMKPFCPQALFSKFTWSLLQRCGWPRFSPCPLSLLPYIPYLAQLFHTKITIGAAYSPYPHPLSFPLLSLGLSPSLCFKGALNYVHAVMLPYQRQGTMNPLHVLGFMNQKLKATLDFLFPITLSATLFLCSSIIYQAPI